MKVTLPKDYRDYTIREVDAMKTTVKWFKEYEDDPKRILENIARRYAREHSELGLWGDPVAVTVVECVARPMNAVEYDAICDGSGRTDVCIYGYVTWFKGVLRIFAGILDIWGYEGDNASVTAAIFPER